VTDRQTDRHVAIAITRASVYSVARVKIHKEKLN